MTTPAKWEAFVKGVKAGEFDHFVAGWRSRRAGPGPGLPRRERPAAHGRGCSPASPTTSSRASRSAHCGSTGSRADHHPVHHRARRSRRRSGRPVAGSAGAVVGRQSRRAPGRVRGPAAPGASAGPRSPRGSAAAARRRGLASATTAISAVLVSGRSSSAAKRSTTPSMSAWRLPRSGSSSCSSKSAASASTTSSFLPAQRRYRVVLATPARAATSPSVSPPQPSSTSAARVASRIARSASALLGRPVRLGVRVGRAEHIGRTIPAGRFQRRVSGVTSGGAARAGPGPVTLRLVAKRATAHSRQPRRCGWGFAPPTVRRTARGPRDPAGNRGLFTLCSTRGED